MNTFSELLVSELGIVLFLAVLVLAFVIPSPLLHVFRGGESATPLAFIIMMANAIAVSSDPKLLSHPNPWFATIDSLSITFVMCLLGARIIHFLRHAKANVKQKKVLIKSLKDQGMSDKDVDNLIQQARSKKNE